MKLFKKKYIFKNEVSSHCTLVDLDLLIPAQRLFFSDQDCENIS